MGGQAKVDLGEQNDTAHTGWRSRTAERARRAERVDPLNAAVVHLRKMGRVLSVCDFICCVQQPMHTPLILRALALFPIYECAMRFAILQMFPA